MLKYCFIIVIVSLLASCSDASFSPLHGKWQLKTVERGGTVTPVDTVWYNFQSKSLFSIQYYRSAHDDFVDIMGMCEYKGDVLTVEMLWEYHLDEVGWNSRNRTFAVEKHNSGRLLLRDEEGALYSFIRF